MIGGPLLRQSRYIEPFAQPLQDLGKTARVFIRQSNLHAAVHLLDGAVHVLQEVEARLRYPDTHHPPIGRIGASAEESTLPKLLDQSCGVGRPVQHPFLNVTETIRTLPIAAQYPEDVVLLVRDPERVQLRLHDPEQPIAGEVEVEDRLRVDAPERGLLDFLR